MNNRNHTATVSFAWLRNELMAEVAEAQREFAALQRRQSKIVHLAARFAAIPEMEDSMNEEKLLTPSAVDAVRAALEERRQSQQWLAGEIGLSEPGLSLMLNRKRECTAANAVAIAVALGLPVALVLPPAHREAQAVAS